MTLTFNVITAYEALLEEVVILAAFIPILIGTGGNVGSQVATLVVRALATRELELKDYFKIFVKETGTGILLGLDERFTRKWSYYLSYCEAAFALRNISVVHTLHTRANNLALR
jgi:hypothetical protein